MFDGFAEEMIDADGMKLLILHGGSGPAVLLLRIRVITADPDAWYRGDPNSLGAENYDEFRVAVHDPDVVRGML
ncbi:hypothetical protein [Arthrobacter castelli]|uniref:hypothetical protein n=1 Tax=Arthrobacter castelli TaxID=271431 RepID=UPI0003F78967|nr:hypothetical protein [Arthrobacter castelli]